MPTHDDELAQAFDGQAERFERSPVMTEAASLARLVAVGRAPGRRARARRGLRAGARRGGVPRRRLRGRRGGPLERDDPARPPPLRAVRRARARSSGAPCTTSAEAPFDACVSRNVLHHVEDPARSSRARRPSHGRVASWSRSTTSADPDPERAAWARRDRARPGSDARSEPHARRAGRRVRSRRARRRAARRGARSTLDFDEWFDRGTPAAPKDAVRARLLEGTSRGFAPRRRADGGFEIRCLRALVRGTKPR